MADVPIDHTVSGWTWPDVAQESGVVGSPLGSPDLARPMFECAGPTVLPHDPAGDGLGLVRCMPEAAPAHHCPGAAHGCLL